MSLGIDVDKTNVSSECIVCHSWYYLHINFRFDPKVCNSCHDLMQRAMSSNEFSVKGKDDRIHFCYN